MSVSATAIIKNLKGIHARPSSIIALESSKYKSTITLEHSKQQANAKDILQILILQLFCGSIVNITADGDDEEEALQATKQLLEKEYNFD